MRRSWASNRTHCTKKAFGSGIIVKSQAILFEITRVSLEINDLDTEIGPYFIISMDLFGLILSFQILKSTLVSSRGEKYSTCHKDNP